jgi:hypothetical protein
MGRFNYFTTLLYSTFSLGAFLWAHLTWSTLTPWSAAYGMAIAFCCLVLAKERPAVGDSERKLVLFGLLVVGFVTRFYHINTYPIWTDEVIHNGFILKEPDTFMATLIANQPPTYYYLSILAHHILPSQPFVPRIFPALFGALSVPLFYLTMRRYVRSNWLVAFATCIFVFEPSLLALAKEGKPYGLGIFATVAFLYAMIDENPRRLFAIALLFLFSLGMQPPVIIALVSLFLLIEILVGRSWKKERRFVPLFLAGAIFLPFFYKLLVFSGSSFSSQSNTGFWSGVLARLLQMEKRTSEIIQQAPPLYLELFVLFSIVAIGSLVRGVRHKWLVLLSFIFPLFLTILFLTFIVDPFNGRYLVLGLPILILAVAVCFDSFGKWIPIICVALALLLFIPFSQNRKPIENKWVDVYSFFRIKEFRRAEGFVFTHNVFRGGIFGYNGFIGLDYYYDDALREKIRLRSFDAQPFETQNQIRYLLESLASNREPDYIYLFSPMRYAQGDFRNYRFPFQLEFYLFKESTPEWTGVLIEIPNALGFRKTLELFFQSIVDQEKNFDLTVRPSLFLLGSALQVKDCKSANRHKDRVFNYVKEGNQRSQFFDELVRKYRDIGCSSN